MSRFIAIFIFLLTAYYHLNAQHFELKGKVTDEGTGEVLAFVNISFDGSSREIVSNIDGLFAIRTPAPVTKLTFRYKGYFPQTIQPDQYAYNHELLVRLKRSNELPVPPDTIKKRDTTWYTYRPLTAKDSTIFTMIDSIKNAEQADKNLKVIDAWVSGYIPFGIFYIDYHRFLSYNRYESIRPGLGLMTNEKVASFFSVGGYIAYGCKDKDWKYGPMLQLFPAWGSETRLTIRYSHDVQETGQYTFPDDRTIGSTEWYRNLIIKEMNRVDEKEIAFRFRPLKYLEVNIYLNQSTKHIDNYSFILYQDGVPSFTNDFHFTEAGVSMKFGFKENFIVTSAKRRLSLGSRYPLIWLNLKKGLTILDGKFAYTKYEIKISQKLTSKKFGQSDITLVAGKVSGNIPISNLYNGRASYRPFSIEARNSFGTMRWNEFCSSEFISVFAMQNIGNILFHTPGFHPEWCLVTNIGYGRLRNAESHQGTYTIKAPDKGYYESGLFINKLLTAQPVFDMGAGILYRYGPYAFLKVADNFAFKLTLNISI
jgi:hypothetical protein